MVGSSWTILLVALTVQAQSISKFNDTLNVDLAVLIHGQFHWWPNTMTRLKQAIGIDLPKVSIASRMGINGSRLAAVASNNGTSCSGNCGDRGGTKGPWHVYTGLTGDSLTYENKVSSIASGIKVNMDIGDGLQMIREYVFVGEPSRPRAIVIFSMYHRHAEGNIVGPAVSTNAYKEVKLLREDGVVFYVFFETSAEEMQEFRAQFADLTGDPNLVKTFTSGSANDYFEKAYGFSMLVEMSDQLRIRICEYQHVCFFDKDGSCKKSWHTPSVRQTMVHAGGDCEFIGGHEPYPLVTEFCEGQKCYKACDTWWKWSATTPECSHSCGMATEIHRVGGAPWKQMEHCPRKFQCAPCGQKFTIEPLIVLRRGSESKGPSATIIAIVVSIILIVVIACAIGSFLIVRRKKGKKRRKGRKANDVESGKKTPRKSKKKAQSKSKKPSLSKKEPSAAVSVGRKKKGASKSVEASVISETEKKAKSKSKSPASKLTTKGKKVSKKK